VHAEDRLHIVGMFVIFVVLTTVLLNGIFMLTSPIRWYSLPKWLRFEGYYTRERVDGNAWRLMQVRIAGSGLSAISGYMLFAFVRDIILKK
jgi:hypothetical protein